MMRFPTHATKITSDTIARPCVKESPGLNRLRACEAFPVLRTGLRPGSISEQVPCSENGGDMRIHRHLTTSDADSSADQSLASEGAESEDTSKDAGQPCSPSMLDGSNDPQESHQSSVSEGDKLHGELPEGTPVALRTRSKRQHQDAHTLEVNDILDRSQTGNEVKELILQLIEQNEEQKNKLSSALECHQTIVKKLQWDIAKLRKRSSRKFKVSFPNSDRRRVKRFTPTDKSDVQKFDSSGGLSASAALLPELPPSEIYDSCMTRVEKAEAALIAHRLKGFEHHDRSDDVMRSLNFEYTESLHAALMANVRYTSEHHANGSDDLKGPVDTSDLDSSAESESLSHHDDYEDSVADTSDNLDASMESEHPNIQDTRRNNDTSQGYKRKSYIVPKESKKDRTEAAARISKALDQVDLSVHLNPKGKRNTATLYVGNLDFNASEQDLGESLDKIFRKIRVEKITIPRVQGRSKYGFVEISWAQRSPVKIKDICIKFSGMIQVNSRPIYFSELRNKDRRK